MNLSQLFVRRPIMTTLVMAAILIFGLMSYRVLPISDLPNVDYPTIQVTAARPGASPETMAASVARPLEKQFSSIAGLDSLNSTSTHGKTQLALQFNLSRGIDDAAQDVEAAISSASGLILNDLPSPPTYSKVNPADQPILYLYLDSPTLPLSQVDNLAETYLAQKLSTISGVAQVQVYGSQKYAARIQIDPTQLASRQIGLDQVQTALQKGNVNLPTGSLSGDHKNYTVQTNEQLEDAAAYQKLIVAYKDGASIYLNQLGQVIDGVEDADIASWLMILVRSFSPLGITSQQIEDTLRNAYGAYQVSTIYAASNEYKVILELEPQYQQDPNALMQLYVMANSSSSTGSTSTTSGTSTSGQLVPLSTFATIAPGTAPLMVNHVGRMNAATISFNLSPGVALSEATNAIDTLVKSTIPNNITTSFQGSSQVFQSSIPSLLILLLIAILVIYLILGVLYEDFVHPITILSGLPSAGFGAGSESRRPLGIAVVGGLIFSQILTLYLTPVFYIYIEAWRKKLIHTRFARFLSIAPHKPSALSDAKNSSV